MPYSEGVDGRDRVVVAVGAVALLALAARLVALGGRTFHWDEARVGYWALRFLETGAFEYRPVAGGPFLYVVDRHVFALLPETDSTARLIVALVGGLLPLAALLFRSRLRDGEVVALAAILAADPLLLYYSRFLRGDVPLAAFALVAVGSTVRAWDTGRRRFVYLGAAAAALALTTSGFVVGYLVCLLAAAGLTFDHHRLLSDPAGARAVLARGAVRLRGASTTLARAFLLAFVVVLYFYAPRTGGGDGPGLWKPTTFPAVLEAAFTGSAAKFYGVRVLARRYEGAHSLVPYVVDYASLLLEVALPVLLLAVAAFLRDRYRAGGPRPLVAFFGYWGFGALFVFPVVTELNAPWVGVHAVAPLSVPAAVGLASVVRFGHRAFARDDAERVAAAALVVFAVGSGAVAVVAADVYAPPAAGSPLVHYAQPADDLDPMLDEAAAAIEGNEGTDVLFYGERFHAANEAGNARPPVADAWGNRLPLPWYFERMGARTASVSGPERLSALAETPPVVVADASARGDLDARLDGYGRSEYRLALWNRAVVVYVADG